MATSGIPNYFNQRMNRSSVSVLTYAQSCTEGIHFYCTTGDTADNPKTASHAFMIFKASSGITIFALSLGSRDAYINSTNDGGSTWGGWKRFTEDA